MEPIDVQACVAKIRLLAAALAGVAATYGLDIPEGCDASIPRVKPERCLCGGETEPGPQGSRSCLTCGNLYRRRSAVEVTMAPSPTVDLRLLAEALAANEARPSRIVSIPGVVRWLAEKVSLAASLADVHAALLAAVERRELELRAVDPSELTRRGDADLCPPAPNGKVLAFGRRLVVPPAPRCARCGKREFAPVHDEGALGPDAHAFI